MKLFQGTRFLMAGGAAALLLLLGSGPASAYIDPGTGGMLLQLLLGGIAGALVVIRLYWARFKGVVGRLFGKSEDQKASQD